MNWLGIAVGLIAIGAIVEAFRKSTYPPLPLCDCSVHDITTPGAAHADDCPAATHND